MAEKKICGASATSISDPVHIHTCGCQPHDGGHVCSDCRRWFGA